MKKKENNKKKGFRLQKAWIILITIAFTAPILFRALPIGSDSIYYIGLACNTTPSINTGIWENIVKLLPCNVLAFKLIAISLALLSAFGLYLIAQTLFKNQKQNWLIILFAFGLTFLAIFFVQTENDQAGLTLGILATALFLRTQKEKTTKHYAIKIITATIALLLAIAIWKATALLFVWWIFYNKFFLVMLLPITFFLLPEITPSSLVDEQISFYGFFMIGASIFYFWKLSNKAILFPFGFFFLLTLIKVQFWVFAALLAPFIVLESYYATKPEHRWLFFVGVLAMSIIIAGNISAAYPNYNDIAVTKHVIDLNKPVSYDWSNAWLTFYLGGNPNTLNAPSSDNNVWNYHGLVLSATSLYDCNVVYAIQKDTNKVKALKLQECS